MGENVSDSELRADCLNGIASSWRVLFRRYHTYARRIALAPPFEFPEQVAEDVAQDTMLALCERLDEVRNLKGFVGTVAHNRCVDKVRKREEPTMSEVFGNDSRDGENGRAVPAYLTEDPADQQALIQLQEMIAQMGQRCRTLLSLRFFDERQYREIAEERDVPVNQVGVYLSRCLSRLRDTLKEQKGLWEELAALL